MLRELYRQRTLADPGREAIRFRDQVISHGELLQRLEHWCARIEAVHTAAAGPEGRLLWAGYGGDTVEHLLLGIACFLSLRPLLLLPLHASEEELLTLVGQAGVGAVLSDRPLPPAFGMEERGPVEGEWRLWARPSRSPAVEAMVAVPGACSGAPVMPGAASETRAPSELARRLLDQTAGLAMSSGTTTGVPTITPSAAFDSLAMLQHPEWPLSRRMLFSFRMQFAASRSWALRILMEGGTLCCVRVEERPQIPELAGALEADTFSLNPAFLEEMLLQRLETRFPASLQFLTGTDRVPVGLRRRFRERFGERLTIALANSRLGPLTLLPPDQLLAHDGEAVGYPLANVRFAFDPHTDPRWQAEGLGEAVVSKTLQVSLHHPEHGAIDLERTEAENRPGDLLRRWPDGLLSFGGRSNDVFLFRSLLVCPLQIENLLAEDGAVEEVVAFGASSSVYGAVPMAALRLRQGVDPEQVLPRLKRLAQAALGVRAPKALIPMEEIPRGASGKPLRRELARLHALT